MTARALPALRPRWMPLKVGGAWNPALRDLADKASGVYVVRRKADGVVLYVGESRTGRLWKTLIRHFQDWSSLPEHFYDRDGNRRRGAETFQHKRPELLDAAIFVTSRGARSRAEGDQAALDLQARAIAKFQPATNVDDGRAEVGPFEQAEEDDYFSQFSRENPGDVFAAVARERADREARIAAWVARHGTRPFDAQGRGGVHLLVSPDPSKAGRWRVTRFEGETPIGHTEAATFEDAARLCEREYGGRVPDVRMVNPAEEKPKRKRRETWPQTVKRIRDGLILRGWSAGADKDDPEALISKNGRFRVYVHEKALWSAQGARARKETAERIMLDPWDMTAEEVELAAVGYDVRELRDDREAEARRKEAAREENALRYEQIPDLGSSVFGGTPFVEVRKVQDAKGRESHVASLRALKDGHSLAVASGSYPLEALRALWNAVEVRGESIKVASARREAWLAKDPELIAAKEAKAAKIASLKRRAAPVRPAGYGEPDKKRPAQLRLVNPSKRARLEVPRGELVTLGALVEVSARREDGQIAVWRWSLRNAPALAYDARGRLFVVYGGRVVGRASDKARREYRRAHWGVPGRGYSLEGSILGGTARTVGEGVSVSYATQKGADPALVDYVHAWGDGARGEWSAPRVCQEGDRVAFVGGTYRVNDRGIVG